MIISIKDINKSFKLFKRKAGLKGALKSFFKRDYYQFHALRNISLNINEGEIIGILGENGAGKTTLIKLMVGLLHPTSGSIVIDGYNPWKRNHEFLKKISIVMGQKNQLWWDIPASESFLLNKHIYGIEDSKYEKILNELVDYLDVKEKIDVQVRRLSLGERMKMEIIAALLHQPKIVLLDEPTLGLDVISQSKIREFVKHYNNEYKTTFVITSHYTQDIQEMCKRVHVLNKGESVYDGDFSALIKSINPKRRLVFEFTGDPDMDYIDKLRSSFPIDIKDRILSAELSEDKLRDLLKDLLSNHSPQSMSFIDLPVEETMKNFFENPNKYL
tara:strand:+ start:1811 stop:2800 length:990 start_codon:yes stop_codon:yes gene_type:complete